MKYLVVFNQTAQAVSPGSGYPRTATYPIRLYLQGIGGNFVEVYGHLNYATQTSVPTGQGVMTYSAKEKLWRWNLSCYFPDRKEGKSLPLPFATNAACLPQPPVQSPN
jgi:hypothetical protein